MKNIPGPGSYDIILNGINDKGKYSLSKMTNTLTPIMSLPTLTQLGSSKNSNNNNKFYNGIPGPGSYSPKLNIEDGKTTVWSIYRNPKMQTFYHSDRFKTTNSNINSN
jgi:hypothetical protein